ncbi:hypothetical protein Lfu02_67040 [Longispora fulva]|uniref:Uncharacterized protein n=1 Tax=Longispora fulva TaxID=619741 RepID=A0A8J7GKW6_9ACTN|nr:hypothetical protein [Longispora fulva]MBG6138563.1 hypothetical protein [Longispora fulva]GIG62332.1 hypothetical protein Lfu02_67040 [Longispora fulva]
MKLTFVRKWEDSGKTGCPALYEADRPGMYVVQGWKLDAETRAQLRDLACDEDAILVPADVIAGIRAGEIG